MDVAVKDEFYRAVAERFAEEQVIILENEDPPAELEPANVVRFTASDEGRTGFIVG